MAKRLQALNTIPEWKPIVVLKDALDRVAEPDLADQQ
jgi:hypothetical protein